MRSGLRTAIPPLGALAVICALVTAARAQDTRIPILVKGAGQTEGFTDPSKDREDSAGDLCANINAGRVARVAYSEEEAVIILEVLGRETKRETSLLGRQNRSYLTVKLSVGDTYSTEFVAAGGSSGLFTGYGAAAQNIVTQVERWIAANREQLAPRFSVRIHTYAAKPPSEQPDHRETLKAVKDVAGLVTRRTRDYEVVPASGFGDAHILLEVVNRERTATKQYVIHLKVRFGEHTVAIEGRDEKQWIEAAWDGVCQVHDWIATNRALVFANVK